MGIRFFCPQGHKLNVKSFLAGKTGFCPHCNVRVEIPLTSTRQSSKDEQETGAAAQAQPAPTSTPQAAVPVAQRVADSTSAGSTSAGSTNNVPVAQPAPANDVPVARPARTSSAEAASVPSPVLEQTIAVGGPPDPIQESPAAIWYVRPATGGQYGPANGEAMRQWLSEGRVGADSLVWREGWPDWRTAATTFPDFAAQAGPIQGRPS